jgi:predicted enzyme related to lactoylglutathione lyase
MPESVRTAINLPERADAPCSVYRVGMEKSPVALIEFPADEPERARRFWTGLLGGSLEPRTADEGEGWQMRSEGAAVGVHGRGPGPGDSFSLPYFGVPDLSAALERVRDLGGTVIHPGDRWAICKDSEGSPFGLAVAPSASVA